MYLDGYEEEGLITRSTSTDPTVVSESQHRSGGSTITDRKHHIGSSLVEGELTAFGLREQRLG